MASIIPEPSAYAHLLVTTKLKKLTFARFRTFDELFGELALLSSPGATGPDRLHVFLVQRPLELLNYNILIVYCQKSVSLQFRSYVILRCT